MKSRTHYYLCSYQCGLEFALVGGYCTVEEAIKEKTRQLNLGGWGEIKIIEITQKEIDENDFINKVQS
jgi:hypothetical protein